MARKLTKDDLGRYQALLGRLRNEIVGDMGQLEADAFSTDGERGSVDNPADSGSDSFAQEFSLELLQHDEGTLEEVEAALERLSAGEFGRCQGCRTWIPKARLNAVPYARRCVSCQRSAEAAD